MKFEDLVAFAKAGYSPADVKELMSMEVLQKEEPQENPTDDVKKEEPVEASGNDDIEHKDIKEDIDYKALYEDSQKKLKEAQKANVKQDISDKKEKSDEEHLNDLFRSFLN